MFPRIKGLLNRVRFGTKNKQLCSPHLKDPTYNFPLSFFFLQEKRTIVIKVEALGGPGRMVITMCLEDNQAADSVFP